MNKLFTIVAISFALLTGTAQAADKVAVVDLAKIIKNIPQSEQVQNTLQKEFDPLIKELKDLDEKMKSKKEAARRDEALMTDAQKKDLMRELEELDATMKIKSKALQQDSQARQREENSKLIVVIQKAISDISEKEGYSVVLESQSMLYFNPTLDISNKVIEHLSKK